MGGDEERASGRVGGESGSRRKSRQPERRQKDELEWERKGRSRGIYIRVYICRARSGAEWSGRASDALLKEENGENCPVRVHRPLFPLSRYLFV